MNHVGIYIISIQQYHLSLCCIRQMSNYKEINVITILLLASCFNVIMLSQCKLAQVVSMFRHGSRYVLSSLYDGNDTRPYWGELTATGMRQHQTLGEMLRKEYIDKLGFLPPVYDRTQMQVYSTAYNRTVQSAESQLYGVYPLGTGPKLLQVQKKYYIPPFSNQTDNPEHNYALPFGYQPIPIKFDQKVMMDDCLQQEKYRQRNVQMQLDAYKEMNMTYWPFIKRMANIFNISGNVTLSTMSSLNSGLECDRYIGKPLPKDFTEDDANNLKHLDSWYKQFTFVKDLAKAVNKDRLVKIMNMFDSRIKNPNQAMKWTFLSGHDLDMVPLYNDLNMSSSQCIEQLYRKGQTSALNCEQYPQFASSLIFQLYMDGLNHTVKIRSNGKYMNLCNEKSTECKYEDWKKRVQANLATDTLAESICGKKSSVFLTENGQIKQTQAAKKEERKTFASIFKDAYMQVLNK